MKNIKKIAEQISETILKNSKDIHFTPEELKSLKYLSGNPKAMKELNITPDLEKIIKKLNLSFKPIEGTITPEQAKN